MELTFSLLNLYLGILQILLLFSWRRQWHPTPVLLPGKSHGRRSLVGCSPWDREESDTTERLHFHFSLSCTGEGNGNPLQCSCLENPRDTGAWWAAIYGVAQSWTQLKQLSSSSIESLDCFGQYEILTILILPVHECGIFSHLFISSSVIFIKFFQFSVYRSFTSLVKFITTLFFLLLL